MPDDTKIEVSLGADASGLQQGMAAGASAVQAATGQMKVNYQDFAKALAAAGGDLRKVNLDLNANAAAARDAAAATSAAANAAADASAGLKSAAGAAESAAEGQRKLRLGTAGATREFIVLGHEVMTGNFSRIPGSILVLTERMGGLRGSMLGTIAAIGAVGGALYELGNAALEAQRQLQALENARLLRGGGSDFAAAQKNVAALRQEYGLSGKEATGVATAMETIPRATDEQRAALSRLMPELADLDVKGRGAAAVSEEIAKVASGGAQAILRYGEGIDLFNDKQIAMLETGRASHDQVAAVQVLIDGLTARIGADAQHVKGYAELWRRAVEDIGNPGAAAFRDPLNLSPKAAGLAPEHMIGPSIEETNANVQQLRGTWTGLASELEAQVAQMWKAVAEQWADGTKENLQASNEYARALAAMHRDIGQEAVAATRQMNANLAAEGNLGHTQLLAAEAANWQKLLAGDKLTANQRVEVQRTLNETLAQLHGTEHQEHLRALQSVTDEARRGSEARVAAAQAEVAYTVQIWKEGSDQAIAAQKRLAEAQQEYFDQNAARAAADQERQQTAALAEIDRQEKVVQERAKLREISATDELNQLRQLEQQRLSIIEAGAQAEIAIWSGNEQKIIEIQKRLEHDKQTSQTKLTQASNQAAQQEVRAWDQAFRPIDAGFNTMIRGMLSGRQTFQQAALSGIQQIVTRELEADAQLLFHKLAIYAAEAAGFNMMEEEKQLAQQTTDDLGLASLAIKAIKAIGTYAAEAFAGAYQAIVGIPYVGPALAPAAGATAEAAVMGAASLVSAAGGIYSVPNDMLANIHKEEAVIPAGVANPMRDFFEGGAAGGGHTFNITVNATSDGRMSGADIAKLIAKEVRNANSDLMGLRR
jgi:hypothetical protein